MILFNGGSGGLGSHFQAQLEKARISYNEIRSRLKDTEGLRQELNQIPSQKSANIHEVTWIHFAALVPVKYCEEHPDEAAQTNVEHTLKTIQTFLNWAQASGLTPKVFYVSTGHVYAPPKPGVRVAEDAEVAPKSVYAKTKLEAENRLRAMLPETGSLLIGRVFGLLAPQQRPEYVLPGLVQRALEGRLTSIPGLDNVRDYLDARDVCAHVLRICRLPWPVFDSPIVNICSGEPTSIRDLLAHILRHPYFSTHPAAGPITGLPPGEKEMTWLVGNAERLKQVVGDSLRGIPLQETVNEAVTGVLKKTTG